MARLTLACAFASCLAAAGAAAQDALPPLDVPQGVAPHVGAKHRKAAPVAARPGATQSVLSDLVHGSADQQALERADNERANPGPIDRHKNEFFSDWRGFK